MKGTYLITGGTGSLGKMLVTSLLGLTDRVVVVSRDERKQAQMQQEYKHVDYILGDVRNRKTLMNVFRGVDYVIHAAALKRIDSCHNNPWQAVLTNVVGSQNVIDAAVYNGVKKVIALSSDKACSPSGLYGATKLVADYLFISGNWKTKFSTIRMGNFHGSRGSVQEYWEELWQQGFRVLPLTHPETTRFYISLEEAAKFVIKCLNIMEGGEIFAPKMNSRRIVDLAPEDATFAEMGMRPGEKLHELLVTREDSRNTVEFKDYYITYPNGIPEDIGVSNVPEGFEYSSEVR
jgi:UDP-N-acetylglucosamine 4,6-dehydratase